MPLIFQCILLAAVDGMAEDTVEVANFLQRRVAYIGSPGSHSSTSTGFLEDLAQDPVFFRPPSFDGASIAGRPHVSANAGFAETAVVAEVAAEAEFAMARIRPAEGYNHNGSDTSASSPVATGESLANAMTSPHHFYPVLGRKNSDADDGEDPKAESMVRAPPVRSKTALLCIELIFGILGFDRLFLGAPWSGLLKLTVSFSAARLGARKGCCTPNVLLLAWGPWGAADSAVILANALQGKASIDILGMRSDFEPASLDAAGSLGVFGAVLYTYFLCKVLSHQMSDAKIGFGVPDSNGVGGGAQREPFEGGGDRDGGEPGSSFAVPGTTAEVISHATAMVTQQAFAVNALESPSDLSCVVCCEAIEEGHNVRVLPCLHRFHVGCVDRWLVQSRTCPVCKQDIIC